MLAAGRAAVAPTRERLLDAARQVIEAHGYGGASVLAVADRAGVAVGTLYRHFSSKEELLVEFFRAACDRELAAVELAARGSVGEGAGRIANMLATFAERAMRRPRLAWALLAEPVDPLVEAERLIYRERFRSLVAEELRRAIDAGELPAQDTELTAAALVGGCAEVLTRPLGGAAEHSPEALRAFVLRAVGGG